MADENIFTVTVEGMFPPSPSSPRTFRFRDISALGLPNKAVGITSSGSPCHVWGLEGRQKLPFILPVLSSKNYQTSLASFW